MTQHKKEGTRVLYYHYCSRLPSTIVRVRRRVRSKTTTTIVADNTIITAIVVTTPTNQIAGLAARPDQSISRTSQGVNIFKNQMATSILWVVPPTVLVDTDCSP